MATNEAGVMVNAKLNMKDVKKELDAFFSSTVKNIKTTIDFSNLVNSLKMVDGVFVVKWTKKYSHTF